MSCGLVNDKKGSFLTKKYALSCSQYLFILTSRPTIAYSEKHYEKDMSYVLVGYLSSCT